MSDKDTDKPFKLTEGDLRTSTWKKLDDYLQGRLADLREQNDNDLDELKTAKQRGRLAEVKDLLALAQPDPATTEADAED